MSRLWAGPGPAHFAMNFHFSRNKWAGPGPTLGRLTLKLLRFQKSEKMKKWSQQNKKTKFWSIQMFKNSIWKHISVLNQIYEWLQKLNSSFEKWSESAQGRPWAGSQWLRKSRPRPRMTMWAGPGPTHFTFQNLNSVFGIVHKSDSKRLCVSKYYS